MQNYAPNAPQISSISNFSPGGQTFIKQTFAGAVEIPETNLNVSRHRYDKRRVNVSKVINYENALKQMAQDNSVFLNTKITKDFELNLNYPRTDFINNFRNEIKDLEEKEKQKIYNYFDFEIKENDEGIVYISGYPINFYDEEKLAEIQKDSTKEITERLIPLVDKFNHNKITVKNNPELSSQLNYIISLFPELNTIIGKKQHKTHHFTVDIHTLKVLQGVMSDPEYKTLSEEDRKIINTATLLHDIAKIEGITDKRHPHCSAIDAYNIIQRMNLPESENKKIYTLIKNHDWLERYNGSVYLGDGNYRKFTDAERTCVAKDIASELREGDMFKMAVILAKADMKAVKENDAFYERFRDVLEHGEVEIMQLIK